jgi:hypothetical protein
MIFDFRFSILDWAALAQGYHESICPDIASQPFGQSKIENPKSKIP